MSNNRLNWYLKAQAGVLLLPVGLCLFGEAVSRKVVQMMGGEAGEWFWTGTLSLICINAGIGLMIESGLTKGSITSSICAQKLRFEPLGS